MRNPQKHLYGHISCIKNNQNHTLGAITPGKSRVGSISKSTSTPEVYVGLN